MTMRKEEIIGKRSFSREFKLEDSFRIHIILNIKRDKKIKKNKGIQLSHPNPHLTTSIMKQ